MTKKKFTTKTRERNIIEFAIDDDTFHFTAPKLAATLMPMLEGEDGLSMARGVLNWLGDGLPETERTRLIQRLTDPEDNFDLDDLEPIYEFLMAEASGRPTKPQRA